MDCVYVNYYIACNVLLLLVASLIVLMLYSVAVISAVPTALQYP